MTSLRTFAIVASAGAALLAASYAIGQRQGRLDATAAQVAPLRDTVHHYDTVYRRDTAVLTRWRTKWDSLTREVPIYKTDTLWVERTIAAADSTIRACSAALLTCERRVDAERRLRLAAEAALAAVPPARSCRAPAAVTGAAGLAIGILLPRR